MLFELFQLSVTRDDRTIRFSCRRKHSLLPAHKLIRPFSQHKEPLMKRSFAAIAAAVALPFHISHALAADLVETASTSGSFKTFLAAAKAAGIDDTLKKNGPYTVFAPGDSAFNKLPPGTMNALLKDKARLAEILSHHVIPGKITVADVKPGKVTTIQGDLLTLTSDNGKVTVDNANVIQSDLIADNGIIHEIDAVVMPPK
ncbi:MAG: fasciclin domain-containing protein [Noviherbaspirillum sp.]